MNFAFIPCFWTFTLFFLSPPSLSIRAVYLHSSNGRYLMLTSQSQGQFFIKMNLSRQMNVARIYLHTNPLFNFLFSFLMLKEYFRHSKFHLRYIIFSEFRLIQFFLRMCRIILCSMLGICSSLYLSVMEGDNRAVTLQITDKRNLRLFLPLVKLYLIRSSASVCVTRRQSRAGQAPLHHHLHISSLQRIVCIKYFGREYFDKVMETTQKTEKF